MRTFGNFNKAITCKTKIDFNMLSIPPKFRGAPVLQRGRDQFLMSESLNYRTHINQMNENILIFLSQSSQIH